MKKSIELMKWHAILKNLAEVDADTIDQDFILFDKPPVIESIFNYPFKMDVVVGIICTKGTMRGKINLKSYCSQSPCFAVILPDQILQYEYLDEDFSGHCIIMSRKFASSLDIQESLPIVLSIRDNPFISLSEDELKELEDCYFTLQSAVRKKDNPFRIEIVKCLVKAFFYSSGYQYYNILESKDKTKQEIFLEDFLNQVKTHYKEQRNLKFYADKLCLTPKHLSKVIKKSSGQSASDWIDSYIVLQAQALLKSTNMTIQQISEELNFPSQSFFGKYFKRRTGMSPSEYKKK